jgi:hypothetical protein
MDSFQGRGLSGILVVLKDEYTLRIAFQQLTESLLP